MLERATDKLLALSGLSNSLCKFLSSSFPPSASLKRENPTADSNRTSIVLDYSAVALNGRRGTSEVEKLEKTRRKKTQARNLAKRAESGEGDGGKKERLAEKTKR